MMTQTLRDLEAQGLIRRNVRQIMPPHVDYSLTELGQTFVEPVELLYHWAIRNADALDRLAQHEASTSE